MKHVTILIPCYNEEASLPLLYDKLAELGNDARYTWEFLFINDGSKDGSLAVLKNFIVVCLNIN